jgi:hypothetical protein
MLDPSSTKGYFNSFDVYRYNCNRFDEEGAKKARDAQEVCALCLAYFSISENVDSFLFEQF